MTSLLPFDTQSKKIIRAMAKAQSQEELAEIVQKSKYAKDSQVNDTEFIESLVGNMKHKLSVRQMRFSTNPAVVLTSYMLLCSIEYENIINIIEGVRYGLDSADILKLLIL